MADSTNEIIKWLLDGDVSIQYQVYRDLLETERNDLRERISQEGWGAKYLLKRKANGHWGDAFYRPKWTSTHYTLLDLKNLCVAANHREIQETISLVLKTSKGSDGGINPGSWKNGEVCITGMFLNYASYFKSVQEDLKTVIDFLIFQQMRDGGFNCYSNRGGAVHSSLHTTMSVLEGISEYLKNGYQYRKQELMRVRGEAAEFILRHKLFRSHRTDAIIKKQMLMLSYPSRWYYDILRAMDFFRDAEVGYDERMNEAINIILKKRNKEGKWPLQQKHPGEVHFDMEVVGSSSRWNTLRALRVLKYYKIENLKPN